MKRYEVMFLFDSAAIHEWSEIEAEVRRLFARIGAEPLVILKYDERKLAYEIKGRKRGTYVLSYFDGDPLKIGEFERDMRLHELILRALVLRVDKLSEEKLAELKAHRPDQPYSPLTSEGRRGDGHGRSLSDADDTPSDEEGPSGDEEVVARPTRASRDS